MLILDRTLALERIIARATDPGVPEPFALAAIPAATAPPPRWPEFAAEEIGALVATWLRADAPRRTPVLAAAPML